MGLINTCKLPPLEFDDCLPIFSSENFELFDQINSAAYFICSIHQGAIFKVSKAVDRLTGCTSKQFKQMGIKLFLSMVHPEDYVELLRNYTGRLGQLRSSYKDKSLGFSGSHKIRLWHREGHLLWLEITYLVLDNSSDEPVEKVFGMIKEASNMKSNNVLAKLVPNSKKVNDPQYQNYHTTFSNPVKLDLNSNGIIKISNREREVLKLIAHGYSSKMVADKLCISTHTAVNHRRNLIDKFKVKNTAELICAASKQFWL